MLGAQNENDRFRGRLGGGDKGDRTPDLVNAIHALSQLSYIPRDERVSTGALVTCQESRPGAFAAASSKCCERGRFSHAQLSSPFVVFGGTSSGCM